jgi:hypothetical protein
VSQYQLRTCTPWVCFSTPSSIPPNLHAQLPSRPIHHLNPHSDLPYARPCFFPLKTLNEFIVTPAGVRGLFELIRPKDPYFASAFYKGVSKIWSKQTGLHLGAQGAGTSPRLQGSRLIQNSPSTTSTLVLTRRNTPSSTFRCSLLIHTDANAPCQPSNTFQRPSVVLIDMFYLSGIRSGHQVHDDGVRNLTPRARFLLVRL